MTVQRILDVKLGSAAHITADATIAELLRSPEFQREAVMIVSSDGNAIEGIVSHRDILRGLKDIGPALLNERVGTLMTTKVLTCAPDDRVAGVMALMMSRHVHHLPVVKAGKLVGMVGTDDLLRLRLDEVQAEAEAMRSYITGGT